MKQVKYNPGDQQEAECPDQLFLFLFEAGKFGFDFVHFFGENFQLHSNRVASATAWFTGNNFNDAHL